MLFFIGKAFADGAAQQQSGGWMSFLPMIAFVGILYFLLIRPQQKKQKEHMALIASIKKGDKVVTSSGLMATVSKVVSDQEVILEIAPGVHCRYVKAAIANVAKQDEVKAIPAPKAEQNQEDKNAETKTEGKAADNKVTEIKEKKITNRKQAPRKKPANKE